MRGPYDSRGKKVNEVNTYDVFGSHNTGLWEIRSRLAQCISRILFTVRGDTMVLLHGFIKKSQKTPKEDLQLAKDRKANLEK